MNHSSYPLTTVSDYVVLAGHMLQALEEGKIPMHAGDYQKIAALVSLELGTLDEDELKLLLGRTHRSIRPFVENALSGHLATYWSAVPDASAPSGSHLHALMRRLALPLTSGKAAQR